jgi:hypothetical protein
MNSSPPAVTNPAASSIWIKIPAILAIAFCLALGISFLRWNPATMALRYQAIAREALDRKDYPTAIVAASRLLSFGGESRNDALFKLALANLGLGRNAETSGIMQLIAPTDRPVYAPAHLFVARTLMARAYRPRQVEQAIAAQLENALTLEPDSREAKELRDRLQNRW